MNNYEEIGFIKPLVDLVPYNFKTIIIVYYFMLSTALYTKVEQGFN